MLPGGAKDGVPPKRAAYRILVCDVALLLASTFLVGIASPALAYYCNPPHEVGIFTRENAHTGQRTAGTLEMRNRSLSDSCQDSDNDQAWSTVQIECTDCSQFRQVEGGWAEYWKFLGIAGYEHGWRFLWEWQVGSLSGGGYVNKPCCDDYRFKLEYDPSPGVWKWYYHQGDTGTYGQYGPDNGYDDGFNHGYPVGETGARNQDTGAADHHYHLSFWKNCSGCDWQDWPSGEVQSDTINGWKVEGTGYPPDGQSLPTPTHYQVVQCSDHSDC